MLKKNKFQSLWQVMEFFLCWMSCTIDFQNNCIISASELRGRVLAGCGTKALSALSNQTSHRLSQKASSRVACPSFSLLLQPSFSSTKPFTTSLPYPRLSSTQRLHIKGFCLPLILITLSPQPHKENHVSQRRHYALRDRFLVRHSRSRPCLRIREVLIAHSTSRSSPVYRSFSILLSYRY